MALFISFFLLSILLFLLNLFFNIVSSWNFFKATNFECGFDSLSSSRLPFSLRFFKICLIFIFFDIEIILILPIPIISKMNFYSLYIFVLLFLIIFLGLVFEWYQGSLNWFK